MEKEAYCQIRGSPKTIQRRGNPYLYKLEEKLTREYNTVLQQEELFWFPKARMDWLKKRNKNTSYFHTITKVRRKCNKMDAVLNNGGLWVYDQAILKEMAYSFYNKLFRREDIAWGDQELYNDFRLLEDHY